MKKRYAAESDYEKAGERKPDFRTACSAKIICWNDSWSGYHYPRIGIITLSKVAF